MANITITNSTISFGHQVIKVANISSVNLVKNREIKTIKNLGIIIIVALVVGFYNYEKENTLWWLLSFIFAFGLLAYLIYLYLNPLYLIVLITNSGNVDLLSSRKYEFINQLKQQIVKAMDAGSETVNVTFNLDTLEVINNNVTIDTVNIVNVSKYQGLSEADKEFLKTTFESSLQKLQNEVSKSTSEEIKRNFEILKQELNSPKPRRSILEQAWSVIQNIDTAASFAEVIQKGISIFG